MDWDWEALMLEILSFRLHADHKFHFEGEKFHTQKLFSPAKPVKASKATQKRRYKKMCVMGDMEFNFFSIPSVSAGNTFYDHLNLLFFKHQWKSFYWI